MQDDNLVESAFVKLKMPNLTESHPEIDTQETNLIVSAVVFKKPCFMESQPLSLVTTCGVKTGVASFFEQA
jgi:hypothetical protein